MSRMRVLATAYACEPGQGSEAGIGWNWARQIAQHHDLWLITRENNVAAIETRARQEGLQGLTVIGFDLPRWTRFWKRKRRGAVAYFYLWQSGLTRLARRLDREHDFDLVHHLTFASSWIPSGLSMVGKPFVWGPVGQHPRVPDRFLPKYDLKQRLAEPAKAFVRRCLMNLDPFLKHTFRKADLILSLGNEFDRHVPPTVQAKVKRFLACGTETPNIPAQRFERQGPLQVLFAGRLIHLKGIYLAIDAFLRLAEKAPDATLDILGDGPLRSRLEERVWELNMQDRIKLLGNRPHPETLERMHAADVFLFPSFEGAGMVVPEAMCAGMPVVCLDFGGPAEMTGDTRGICVPLEGDARKTARALGDALIDLESDEPKRRRLAESAFGWASSQTTWESKGERLAGLYAEAMDRHAGRTPVTVRAQAKASKGKRTAA